MEKTADQDVEWGRSVWTSLLLNTTFLGGAWMAAYQMHRNFNPTVQHGHLMLSKVEYDIFTTALAPIASMIMTMLAKEVISFSGQIEGQSSRQQPKLKKPGSFVLATVAPSLLILAYVFLVAENILISKEDVADATAKLAGVFTLITLALYRRIGLMAGA